jgi:poly-gamma-glutamate synthesis protein (capsule biosynthesis protein)
MSTPASTRTLFLCGDVMTGRGIDQILQHPSRPILYEQVVTSALEYVTLAERAHGPIPRRVSPAYVWGVALHELERRQPAARIINLETSITTHEEAAPKGINYRMHPANVDVLTAARLDCAVLANNHVLDWGTAGLDETLDTLARARIQVVGAGRSRADAEAPAVIDMGGGYRLLVFAFGASDSGVPRDWRADAARPGVNWIHDYSPRTAAWVAALVAANKRAGDAVLVSIHWGSNWGFEIPDEHRTFAYRLIDDAGVDLVYGHSSHHVKAIEVHGNRGILYGCGDFLNDYEGIHGPKHLRDDLTMMYFPMFDMESGALVELELVPLLIRHFRLQRPSLADAHWFRDTVDRECRRFGAVLDEVDGRLVLAWR